MPEKTPSAGDGQNKPKASNQSMVGDDSPKAASDVLSDFHRLHKFWKRTQQVADFVSPTVFVIGVAIAIMSWIDFEIDHKLSDPALLRKIATQATPSLIFDSRESIVADMGAQQYVKNIRIIKRDKNGLPATVSIDFTRYFSTSPILTSLRDMVGIESSRGRMLSWNFDIDWGAWVVFDDTDIKSDTNRLFRLEVVP